MIGTADEIITQLEVLHAAGVQRIMLQWLDLDDIERLDALANMIVPHFH